MILHVFGNHPDFTSIFTNETGETNLQQQINTCPG